MVVRSMEILKLLRTLYCHKEKAMATKHQKKKKGYGNIKLKIKYPSKCEGGVDHIHIPTEKILNRF